MLYPSESRLSCFDHQLSTNSPKCILSCLVYIEIHALSELLVQLEMDTKLPQVYFFLKYKM